ncbi:hypothetical protein PDE_08567 [Penicillium oxalicum 114-2]|uniref:Uncharacterized protein n=1 Tax=Penicillium oxalicum (strain 114-2 / CGMCC 5302) TaxID=933388 RepID=S7ZSB0_PENO1|nr:hypothetical protein PDE_08567 [Penicillium oxalicum 114-2]
MAVGSRDPDGDSEMTSSAGSPRSDSDALDTGARTPTRHHSAMAPLSELSPPGSQPQQLLDTSISADEGLASMAEPQTDGASGKGSELAGAAWNSKRAQDEYHRAMEQVIDKDFNLNEFGDPFDERDLEEKRQ